MFIRTNGQCCSLANDVHDRTVAEESNYSYADAHDHPNTDDHRVEGRRTGPFHEYTQVHHVHTGGSTGIHDENQEVYMAAAGSLLEAHWP